MKELDELQFRDDVRYTEDHEWVEGVGETLKVGVSDYAQDQMGDIVYVELPEIGAHFDKGEQFGTLESVKAVSELYLPVAGEIVAINEALGDSPELINQDAFTNWIVEIKPDNVGQLAELMDAGTYKDTLKG